MTAIEESEVVYTDAVIDEAADAFVRTFFTTPMGRALIAASIVNIAAFALIMWLGVRDRFMLFVVGMIAALGPAYLAMIRFYYPGTFATRLKQRLKPVARIAVTATGFAISANDRAVKLLWSDVRRGLEFPDFYILILRPSLTFTVIPKQGLSIASQQLIRTALSSHAG